MKANPRRVSGDRLPLPSSWLIKHHHYLRLLLSSKQTSTEGASPKCQLLLLCFFPSNLLSTKIHLKGEGLAWIGGCLSPLLTFDLTPSSHPFFFSAFIRSPSLIIQGRRPRPKPHFLYLLTKSTLHWFTLIKSNPSNCIFKSKPALDINLYNSGPIWLSHYKKNDPFSLKYYNTNPKMFQG